MYSRKFNGVGVLPPDYSGVALRDTQSEQSRRQPTMSENCRPRHPVFESDPPEAPTYPPPQSSCPKKESAREENVPQAECSQGRHLPLSGRNFTLEDIMLAGLLLLVMNDENKDSGLLIILGLLLLVGM